MISECQTQVSFSETKRFGNLGRPYSRSSIKKSALTYVATLCLEALTMCLSQEVIHLYTLSMKMMTGSWR